MSPKQPILSDTRSREAAPDCATYVVLGNARGGTSMVAGLLRLLGVFMGDNVGPGNNEDQDFLFHQGRRELLIRRDSIERILAVVAERNRTHRVWGWKDPLTNVYLKHVFPHLRNPKLILIFRDPFAVAMNLHRHGGGKVVDHLGHVLCAYDGMAALLPELEHPVFALSYEMAVRHPEAVADAFIQFVGGEVSDEVRTRAVAFVRPGRGHANLGMLDEDLAALKTRLDSMVPPRP